MSDKNKEKLQIRRTFLKNIVSSLGMKSKRQERIQCWKRKLSRPNKRQRMC
jgi:hypothetical protein